MAFTLLQQPASQSGNTSNQYSSPSQPKPSMFPETIQDRIMRYKQEQQGYDQRAKDANSLWGMTKNFVTAPALENLPYIGGALGLGKTINKIIDNPSQRNADTVNAASGDNQKILQQIRANKTAGKDTTKLEKIYNDNARTTQDTMQSQDSYNQSLPSQGQAFGQISRTGLDVLTAGTYKNMPLLKGSGQLTPGLGSTATQEAGNLLSSKAPLFSGQGFKNIGWGGLKGALAAYPFDVASGLQGQRGEDRTGAASLIPGAITGTGGLVGGGIAAATGLENTVRNAIQGRASRQAEISKMLEGDGSATDKLQNRNPNVPIKDIAKSDPTIKEAVDAGVQPEHALVTKLSSDADKTKMEKMLKIAQQGESNPTATQRPTDIVGDTFMKRATAAKTILTKAGDQLDQAAQSLKGQKVDFSPVVSQFEDAITKTGATIGEDGKIDWTGSDFADIPSAQKMLDKAYTRLNAVGDNAYAAHQLKRSIYNNVEYGKSQEGLPGYAEKILKGLANSTDSVLDTNSQSYNQANALYKQAAGVRDDISQLVGKDLFKDGDFANIKAGMVMRRLLGNGANRADLLQLLDNMEKLATSNGYKSSESIVNQVVFADMMDSVFGTQAKTSLQGETSKAIVGAIGKSPKHLLKSGIEGLVNMATQKTSAEKAAAILKLLRK